MCLSGKAEANDWAKWLSDFPSEEPDYQRLGLLEQEYEDLKGGVRSFAFYIMKRNTARSIFNLWPGCYVKYLYEYDKHEPHFEYGWVDVSSNDRGFCKIQCDDDFHGARAVVVRVIDVMEILPYKERPLVYYKTMICGKCNKCDRSSNETPPVSCPFYDFFGALLSKQKGDGEFIRLYQDSQKNLK